MVKQHNPLWDKNLCGKGEAVQEDSPATNRVLHGMNQRDALKHWHNYTKTHHVHISSLFKSNWSNVRLCKIYKKCPKNHSPPFSRLPPGLLVKVSPVLIGSTRWSYQNVDIPHCHTQPWGQPRGKKVQPRGIVVYHPIKDSKLLNFNEPDW